MKKIIEHLGSNSYTGVLSVQKANYAAKMYRRLGFKVITENDEEYIMAHRRTGGLPINDLWQVNWLDDDKDVISGQGTVVLVPPGNIVWRYLIDKKVI